MTEIRPGSFGLVTVEGWSGRLIRLGQTILGRVPSGPVHYAHAFLVLDAGEVVEAMPSGAETDDLAFYTDPLLIGPNAHVLIVDFEMTDTERERVIGAGRALEGTPYSFLDYFYLAALRLGLPSAWLRERVATSRHMICSQLVDEAYRAAGVHLFDDGRWPGNVTPGDLANWTVSDPRVTSRIAIEGTTDAGTYEHHFG